jgi:CTP-dependent riboflavin kinase
MKQVNGEVISGSGEAAYFTELDWVKQQCREKLGFEPYPGTLNLMVGENELRLISDFAKNSGIKLVPPTSDFCEAICLKVTVGHIKAAAIIPHIDHYYENTIEILAPIRLKDAMILRDGDKVVVTISEISPEE